MSGKIELDTVIADRYGIQNHPGYTGMFTRSQGDGHDVIPNRSRVVKAKSFPGDATPTGTEGVVLGSISHPIMGTCHFIEWDNRPKVAVAVFSLEKIRKLR